MNSFTVILGFAPCFDGPAACSNHMNAAVSQTVCEQHLPSLNNQSKAYHPGMRLLLAMCLLWRS